MTFGKNDSKDKRKGIKVKGNLQKKKMFKKEILQFFDNHFGVILAYKQLRYQKIESKRTEYS